MSVSDRAAAAERYLQTALDDPEVQDALRRAARAGSKTYRGARGKRPGKAVKDKAFQRRAQKTAIACLQLVAAIDAAQRPGNRRRGRRAIHVLAVLASGYAAYLVSNADGRDFLRNLVM
jgi:hypothetical protein